MRQGCSSPVTAASWLGCLGMQQPADWSTGRHIYGTDARQGKSDISWRNFQQTELLRPATLLAEVLGTCWHLAKPVGKCVCQRFPGIYPKNMWTKFSEWIAIMRKHFN